MEKVNVFYKGTESYSIKGKNTCNGKKKLLRNIMLMIYSRII